MSSSDLMGKRERDGSGRDTWPVKAMEAWHIPETTDTMGLKHWNGGHGRWSTETMLKHEQITASIKKVGRFQVGLQGSKLSGKRKT